MPRAGLVGTRSWRSTASQAADDRDDGVVAATLNDGVEFTTDFGEARPSSRCRHGVVDFPGSGTKVSARSGRRAASAANRLGLRNASPSRRPAIRSAIANWHVVLARRHDRATPVAAPTETASVSDPRASRGGPAHVELFDQHLLAWQQVPVGQLAVDI